MIHIEPVQRALTWDALCSASFWRGVAPQLHISGISSTAEATPRQSYERLAQRMAKDGYFGDGDDAIGRMAPLIGEGVTQCIGMGLPAVFAWVYDEPWACYERLRPLFSYFLGADYRPLPAFWAWHVDPKKGETGWKPHRDNRHDALAPDGSPRALTCWIPLSDANPLNSCMYIVPAHMDPGYNTPAGMPEPPIPAFAARALPATPGDYLVWNQRVMHWGGPTSEFAERPRMSMALEFQRGDMPPIMQSFQRGAHLPVMPSLLEQASRPDFGMRLRLIARQILQYQHMYGLSQELANLSTYLLTARTLDT
ncbi:phytanoyl-CoA dioxygenase family protein [Variovorax sp. JS1663]|uniref:phytanoyl-CoA dioxygenase family protein n=1 Tax=Variovorax sp. JS1663 TaxID=1851577 RepID=UPI00117C6A1E|nr:phytanoyl-CoA dioxygenase family protein [Variovorax sp. JS1663]